MSITTWTRLEPDTQTGYAAVDIGAGVAARLADPLWLLRRQWQMGELTGESAASPVTARIDASTFLIDSIQTGSKTVRFAVASVASEAIVEHDGHASDLRIRASGGASFLDRMLEGNLSAYVPAILRDFSRDAATPDGDRLLAAFDANTLSATLAVATGDLQTFTTICHAWAAWYRPRAGGGMNPAWVPDRLEYTFSMNATVTEGRLTLDAPEHNGGRLDWDSFTARAPVAGAAATPRNIVANTTPAVLQMPGMPAFGFWQIEDPRFDAGRIEAAPGDPARLLLIETALAYASDWFLLSLRLPVASLTRINRLSVTDTFGVTTLIRPATEVRPHAGWRLWEVSNLPYLLLPPPDIESLTSEPIEQTSFVRDEAANLAWALRIVPPPSTIPAAVPATGAGDLLYVPFVPPRDNRIPLPLVETTAGRWLVRGSLVDQPTIPTSDLLSADFRLRDEDLPDEGLQLLRRFELGRTPDGTLHLWVSRLKQPVAQVPSSGLTFDQVL
jgi:hypothetical protein